MSDDDSRTWEDESDDPEVWVKVCMDYGELLNVWEVNFIDRMHEIVSQKGDLSENQRDKLQEIYRRIAREADKG